MGFFARFKRNRLSAEEKRWNRMWELWVKGKAKSPAAELMTYQAEVNNGGHSQFFDNTESIGELEQTAAVLRNTLTGVLLENFNCAYAGWQNGDDDLLNTCDEVYYANEAHLQALLHAYAEA